MIRLRLFGAALVMVVAAATAGDAAPMADDYQPGTCISNTVAPTPFVDVPTRRYFTNAVGWAYGNGITTGVDDSHFAPEQLVDRAQFATLLHRMRCEPTPADTAPFLDLVAGAYYRDAVDWLWGESLTRGKATGRYAPGDPLTRGEFATFLHRLVGAPLDAPVNPFGDVDRSRFFAVPIDWLFDRGVTNGTSATTFSPHRSITRGEVVTLLYRLNLDAAGVKDPAELDLTFTTVLTGLDLPVGAAVHPTDGALYVIEKPGRVLRVAAGGDGSPDFGAGATTVLDITAEVADTGERGLLGIAVSPDGTKLYLSFTQNDGDSQLREYDLVDGVPTGPPRVDLVIDQPASNHNGGHIAFGPDGYLYATFGDGGGGGDRFRNGQNADTLLGSILRIDPQNGSTYTVPADNPFVGTAGADENWLIGVRNPWRFSFDPLTGDLWIGDVGQSTREEVTRLRADGSGRNAGRGANLGWPTWEGSFRTPGEPDIVGHVGPTIEYGTGIEGRSVTGGVVYRGTGIDGLAGTYLYADFYTAELRGFDDGFGSGPIDYGTAIPGGLVASFFADATGEVYTVSMSGRINRLVAAG